MAKNKRLQNMGGLSMGLREFDYLAPLEPFTGHQMTAQVPINANENFPYLKWGWHFRPTDAELIYNLRMKVLHGRAFEPEDKSDVLREIDLSKVEPWEIKHIKDTCNIRNMVADENNQFFYNLKEQKYRHGGRANRATKEGFWKATGRDKTIFGTFKDKTKTVIGYRKALVFYEGRAPNGSKTDWILHEYRLENGADSNARDEQWVACHMFIKERNGLQSPEMVVEVQADPLQEQSEEKGKDVKVEPGYPSYYYSHAGSSHMGNGPRDQDHNQYPETYERDDLDLPYLEDRENNYPVQHTEMHGALPNFSAGNWPSFNERILNDVLLGIRTDPDQQPMDVEQQPDDAIFPGILWS